MWLMALDLGPQIPGGGCAARFRSTSRHIEPAAPYLTSISGAPLVVALAGSGGRQSAAAEPRWPAASERALAGHWPLPNQSQVGAVPEAPAGRVSAPLASNGCSSRLRGQLDEPRQQAREEKRALSAAPVGMPTTAKGTGAAKRASRAELAKPESALHFLGLTAASERLQQLKKGHATAPTELINEILRDMATRLGKSILF